MPRQIWIGVLLALGTSISAFATTTTYATEWTIDANGSGTIGYNGTGGDLIGTNILVDAVFGVDASGNDVTQTYNILNDVGGGNLVAGGLLSFTSGASTGSNMVSWSWGAGLPPGALSLVGCLSNSTTAEIAAGNGQCIGPETGTTVLITDEFTSATISSVGSPVPSLAFGGLTGTLDSDAAKKLDASTNFVSPTAPNSYAFEDNASGLPSTLGTTPTTGFSATQGQGTLDLVSAPEEWSLLSTLGFFVVGLGVFGIASRRGLVKSVKL